MSSLFSIVYCSKLVNKFKDSFEVNHILHKSRQNNAENNITGLLVCDLDNALQVLEGPKAQVENLFQKITQDARHQSVTKLCASNITERQYPNWQMGLFMPCKESLPFLAKSWVDLSRTQTKAVLDLAKEAISENNQKLFYQL